MLCCGTESVHQLLVTRFINDVTLTVFTWRALVLQYDSLALLLTVGILYFITPFTICLPMMWKTHIYPAVWANCNMFREYSNTPYLADFVGLLIFWYRCVFSKLYGFFSHSPSFINLLLKKCFLHMMKSTQKRLRNFVDHKQHCRPECWHTLLFDPFWRCT